MGALEVSGDIGMEEADTVRTPSPTDKTSLLLDTVVLFSLLVPLAKDKVQEQDLWAGDKACHFGSS